MFRTRRKRFTQISRSVWAAILLVIVMTSPLPIVAKAAITRQGFLPVCLREGHFEIYPSPFYAQDQTLYLREYSPRNPEGFALWYSGDGGHSWRMLLDFTNLSGLIMGPTYPVPIPSDPDPQLYLATRFGVSLGVDDPMLWFSNNAGVTWEARIPCVSDSNCTSSLYPTNESGVLYGVEHYDPWGHFSSGIWRTTDGAQSGWTKVWGGTEAIGLAVSTSYAQDHTLFAGLRVKSPQLGSAVIASTNSGETWEGRGGDYLCDNDVAAVQLSSTFAQDHTAFVHQANSLFKSLDAGTTWQPVFPPDPPYCQVGTSTPEAGDFLLSPNFGQDHTIYLVSQDESNHNLLVSIDGGANWTRLLSLDYYFGLLAVLPTTIEATPVLGRSHWNDMGWTMENETSDVLPNPLTMSTDDQEWSTFLPRIARTGSLPSSKPFTLFIRPSNTLSYYRSDDGGVTWACMELPPPLSP